MEWELITKLINPEFFTIVVACWTIGYILKKTPKFPDWLIIYGVTLFAITFVVSLSGFNSESILQGILCGAVSVYGNQFLKQSTKKSEDNKDSKDEKK